MSDNIRKIRAWASIRTSNPLISKLALYELSYPGLIANHNLNISFETYANFQGIALEIEPG